MPAFITEYPQFVTASIKGWYKLLEYDKYKDIIISSLRFLVEDKRLRVYAFVLMPDHIHLIWQMQPLIHPQHVQRDFLKYTAQRIKHDLQKIILSYWSILNLMQTTDITSFGNEEL
jgi:REP element-mobilizing transposase RayT